MDDIIACLQEKESQLEKQRMIDSDIVIKHGKYGYYIQYKKKTNVSLPSYLDPKTVTKEQCINCIQRKKKKQSNDN